MKGSEIILSHASESQISSHNSSDSKVHVIKNVQTLFYLFLDDFDILIDSILFIASLNLSKKSDFLRIITSGSHSELPTGRTIKPERFLSPPFITS